jgi:hypothetical protein
MVRLESLNLQQELFNDLRGVYVIFHQDPNPYLGLKVVRIGQGNIRERLETVCSLVELMSRLMPAAPPQNYAAG